MKKRVLALLVAAMLAVSISACGSPDAKEDQNQAPQDGSGSANEVKKDNEPAPEPKNEAIADIGKYHVEIKGAKMAKDYEGKSAIVVTYSWTNNSEDTANAMTALMSKGFQDGIEMERAIISDASVYDSNLEMKDIRPGASLDVQSAFVLSNATSPVEIEVGEWITFADKPVVAKMNFDPATLT